MSDAALTPIKQQLQAVLKELGIDTAVQDTKALEQFYAIGRMDSQTRRKKVHVFDLKTTSDKVTVVVLTDVHRGSISSNKAKFQAYIDYVVKTPNCYAIVLGDLMETATKTSVGLAMFEEDMHVEAQMDEVTEMLKPLAELGKLIGIHTGNHENRVSLLVQINPMKMVAERLTAHAKSLDPNLPEIPYLGWQAFHLWKVGDQKYRIHTHHGAGGGSSPGGKLTKVTKMRSIADADLHLMGHVHDVIDYQTVHFEIDPESEFVKERVVKYAVCGSLLGYHDAYPEMAMFPPAHQVLVKIDFYQDRHDIRVYK